MLYEGGIAFFDSGIGGMTTLFDCLSFAKRISIESSLPDFYYYGDNFRAPYGNLPKPKIKEYVLEAFSLFEKLKVSAVVLACNTATAVCVDELRKRYAFPIVGIEPAISYAAKQGGEIFVLATQATCNSNRFQNLCNLVSLKYPNAKIRVFPCPQLAGAIERMHGNERFDYTKYLPIGNPDCVVLGCTHYVYIKNNIRDFYGCEVVDGNLGVAKRLFSLLGERYQKQNLKAFPSVISPKGAKISLEQNLVDETLSLKVSSMVKTPRIFFIGEGKVVNKLLYEQMFGG